jgi:ParB/RepB/Spo0J family partition protein
MSAAAATATPLRSATAVRDIPLHLLDPDPRNPRGEDLGDLSELAASIARHGVLKAVDVEYRFGRYQLVAGHRRRAACISLGMGMIPGIVRTYADARHRLVTQVAEQVSGRNWDPIAESDAVTRMFREHNMSREQIAREIGQSAVWVRNRLALRMLTAAEKKALKAKRITLGDALQIVADRRGGQPPTVHIGPEPQTQPTPAPHQREYRPRRPHAYAPARAEANRIAAEVLRTHLATADLDQDVAAALILLVNNHARRGAGTPA